MSESYVPPPFAPAPGRYLPAAAGPSPYPAFAPKTIGQILDRTYRLMRSHFWLLVGIAAIPSLLLMMVVAAMEAFVWIPMLKQWPKPPDPQAMLHLFNPAIMIPVMVVVTLLSVAIASIYLAAGCYASISADAGVRVTITQAYGIAWSQAGRFMWLMVLVYLCAGLPILLVEGVVLSGASMFASGHISASPALFLLVPLVVLLYIAAIVYGLLMGLRLSLAFPACMAENLNAFAAIKRSFQLTPGAKGRIFLVILVVYAALYAGILILEVLVALLAIVGVLVAVVLHVHIAAPWNYVGLGGLGVCVFAVIILFISLTYAAMTTALAVLYHDQRLRKDGRPPQPLQAGEAV
jgi:hypothetical protein